MWVIHLLIVRKKKRNDGISATHNKTLITAFSNLIIKGNAFKGYKNAITLDNDLYQIEDNSFINCDYCIKLRAKPLHNIKNNKFNGCAHEINSITSEDAIGH